MQNNTWQITMRSLHSTRKYSVRCDENSNWFQARIDRSESISKSR